ncbi:MAG: hypothetical protein RBU37_10925 [Myxococcota bacterium]|jgi:hypothetical protein|nr:hypothetical protein [Myxococcota bacterium]
MSNLVDATLTEAELSELTAAFQTIERIYTKVGVPLHPEQRQEVMKPRKNCEPLVELLISLAVKYDVKLADFPLEGLRNDLTLRRQLPADEARLEVLHRLVADTLLVASGEMWEAFLAYYAVLDAMSSRNAALATELKPVKALMSNVRRRSQPAEG